MQSQINKIIQNEGLKSGDAMKNIRGEDIPNSVVLNDYQVLIGDDAGAYCLRTENAIGDGETSVRLSAGAVDTLIAFFQPRG